MFDDGFDIIDFLAVAGVILVVYGIPVAILGIVLVLLTAV